MNRRRFIQSLGIGAGVVAVAPAVVGAAIIAKPKPEPLPAVHAGQVITESSWNAIVDRLNELSAQ